MADLNDMTKIPEDTMEFVNAISDNINRTTKNSERLVTSYDKTSVYILDAVDEQVQNCDLDIESEHYQKQKIVRRMFERRFDKDKTEIHDVTFPPRTRPQAVIDYFHTQLQNKTRDELVVIYYLGGAGDNGEDYTWRFCDGSPRREIDAYELITTIYDSGIDCLLLLDCYMPSRFKDKWVPREGAEVEIIVTGQPLQHSDGKRVVNDPGDFTRNLVGTLDKFVRGIGDKYKNYHAPKTPLQMLSTNKDMSSNPYRVSMHKTNSKKPDQVVTRLVFCPDAIRASGKIEFFAKRVQGAGVAKRKLISVGIQGQPDDQAEDEEEDEGLADMHEVEDDGKGEEGEGLFVTPQPPDADADMA